MKKIIFGITLSLFMGVCVIADAYQSSVDRAFSDNIRQSDGMISIGASDPLLDIARGLIADEHSLNKTGRNTDIDTATADVWDGGDTGDVSLIWVAPTAARVHAIVSSSASDDGDPVGVGARTLKIYGLIDWDTPEITEVILLNGAGSVNTTQSYVMINRMEVLTKGATSSNVGTITATAASDSTITSQITPGAGRTQQTMFGISSLETLYMGRLYANINNASAASGRGDVSLLYNPEPDVEEINFLTKHTFGLTTTGTSALTINYWTPKVFEGPALIKMQMVAATNNMDVSAGYDAVVSTDISGFNVLVTSNRRILTTSDSRILRTQ